MTRTGYFPFQARGASEPTKRGFDLHEPVVRPTQLRHRSRMDKYWATCWDDCVPGFFGLHPEATGWMNSK